MTEAIRKLSDIDFTHEGAHIALTSKSINGGPANQRTTLLFKGLNEDIVKADVQVKLDIVSFLRTFFNLWSDEAATLAEVLGFDTGFFDEEFSFEKFNTLGASEVTLLKAASEVENTEETLSAYVNDLDKEGLNTLKAYAESFNNKLQEHRDMTELEKALEAQKVELEKEAKVALEKAEKEAKEAKEELEEINKAKKEATEKVFITKAKAFGAEEDLGLAMAALSSSDQGMLVIKALEDAHQRLEEIVEKEAGFTGEGEETETTSIMKAMKEKYEDK